MGQSASVDRDGPSSERDLVSTLATRVEAVESLLRAANGLVDEGTLKELRRTIEALSKRDPKFEERVSNKVGVMADRVEMLAKTVSTSSAAVVAREGEIVQLRRELESALARVDQAATGSRQDASAAELGEVKRAVNELSKLTKEKMPRGLENRVAELADKYTMLAQRVDSLSTTISTTAAGLAGRDGDVTALRRAVETERDRVAGELAGLQRTVDPRPVAELRETLKEHVDETARQQYAIRQLIARTGASVDGLVSRLDALTASATSTASRAADTESGLAAFRTYFEEAGGQLSAHIAEHRRALAALTSRAASLEQAHESAGRVLDERVASIAAAVDELAGRLDTFGDTLAGSESRIAESEESATSLRAYVDDAGKRFGSLLADQRQLLSDLGERTVALEQADGEDGRRLDERISAASDRIDGLADRLDPLSEAIVTMSGRIDDRDDELRALENRFRDSSARVDGLVADLSRALAEFPDPGALTQALDARLDEHAEALSSVADSLSHVQAAVSEQRRTTESRSGELERMLVDARSAASDQSERLDALTVSLEANAARAAGLEQAQEDAGRVLDERVASIAAAVDQFAGRLETFADTLAGSEESATSLRAYVDEAGKRFGSLLADQRQLLSDLGERTAALEQADGEDGRRLDERIAAVSDRADGLAKTVEAAASSLGEKEHELAVLHRGFTESSARIESIVDDIRVALSALPDVGSVTADDLAAYVERMSADISALGGRIEQLETANRRGAELSTRSVGELGGRIDAIDQRLATVAEEVSRAKTLWPVALRSLEARLDDAVHARGATQDVEEEATTRHVAGEPSDDLLVGLRDSLQAMETVAAEMARASDTLREHVDEQPTPEAPEPEAAPAAAAGATIVPLRASDP